MAIAAQDVIDQALDLVEMENATGTTGFAVTNRIQDAFNQGLARLHYTLADGDFDWWTETATIPVVADTATYGLPNGTLYSSAPQFYKMKVLYLVDADKLYPLPKFQEQEIVGWDATGPRTSATLRMHYIPAYVPIARGDWSATNISYPYPPGWEDYVACFIANRLAIRDEQYERAMALSAERDAVLGHIIAHVAPRDIGMPDRVVDVSQRWSSQLHWYYNQNYAYRLRGDNLEIGQPYPLP